MNIPKKHTNLKQSRILAEILPHNTADETFERIVIAGGNFNIPIEQQYKHNSNIPFTYYSGVGIPCWSLATLLNIIPYPSLHKTYSGWRCNSYNKDGSSCLLGVNANTSVDACYEMILKLHEQKLL